jgi:VWFA-related protein
MKWMQRVLWSLAFVLFALGVPAARQLPVFRGGTQTVPVYATVLDGQGRLVPGLTKRDFTILDNGAPVEITTFSNDIMPVALALLLDMSASMAGEHVRVQQAALRFVDALLPEDRVRIGTFGDEIAMSPWLTSDKDLLRRILREEVWPGGTTPLWSAMRAAMRSLDGVTGRRVLLILSDGIDTGCPTLIGSPAPGPVPAIPFAFSPKQRSGGPFSGIAADPRCSSFSEIEQTAAAGEFMTYAIGMEGPGMVGGLERLPDETGGGHFELKRNAILATTFAQVADELHHQYALGFSPSALDGLTHRLDVRLTNRALVARARRSYVAADR